MTKRRPDQDTQKLNAPSKTTPRDPKRVQRSIDRAQSMINKNTVAIDEAHRALDDLDESEERRRRTERAAHDDESDD